MRIIFVLDDQSVFTATPEELQLRQVSEDICALVVPSGKNEEGQDQFRPFITFNAVLTAPKPKPVEVQAVPIPSVPAPTDISIKQRKPRTKKATAGDTGVN